MNSVMRALALLSRAQRFCLPRAIVRVRGAGFRITV
jgi:hypothetical protein